MRQLNITTEVPTQLNRLSHAVKHAAIQKLIRKPDRQSVYLMECEGYYKVGIAADPRKRLSTAQTGSPFELRLVAFKEMVNAKDEERLLHRVLEREGCHVRGEWFKLTPLLLSEILSMLS